VTVSLRPRGEDMRIHDPTIKGDASRIGPTHPTARRASAPVVQLGIRKDRTMARQARHHSLDQRWKRRGRSDFVSKQGQGLSPKKVVARGKLSK